MKKMNKTVYSLIIVIMFLASQFIGAGVSAKKQKAPNFPVYDVNGKRHVFYLMIDALPRGGIMIVNFTSIFCKPCKKEIPELIEIAKGKRKVKLICIYSERGNPVKQSASSLGAMDIAYVDPFGAIRSKYNVEKIPATVLVNKSCDIIGRFEGYTEANIGKIRQMVR